MLAHKAEGDGKGSPKPFLNHRCINEEGVDLIRNQTSAAGDGGPSTSLQEEVHGKG